MTESNLWSFGFFEACNFCLRPVIATRTHINDTLSPLLADRFVEGILVGHSVPNNRQLHPDLSDVHRLSIDLSHKRSKDLMHTISPPLRITSIFCSDVERKLVDVSSRNYSSEVIVYQERVILSNEEEYPVKIRERCRTSFESCLRMACC